MFALAGSTRPIKFPQCQRAGMYAFNERFYTSGKKLHMVFSLLLQITPELNAVKNRGILFKVLHSERRKGSPQPALEARQTARCRKLPCPARQAQALTQTHARTHVSAHMGSHGRCCPPTNDKPKPHGAHAQDQAALSCSMQDQGPCGSGSAGLTLHGARARLAPRSGSSCCPGRRNPG